MNSVNNEATHTNLKSSEEELRANHQEIMNEEG